MNLQKRLETLAIYLENFDLDEGFHDDTFIDMLDLRVDIERHYSELTQTQKKKLYYLDEIINGYTHLFSDRDLSGYAKMSYKINTISEKNIADTKAA